MLSQEPIARTDSDGDRSGLWNLPLSAVDPEPRSSRAVSIANLRDVYAQDFSVLTAAAVTSVAPVVLLFLYLQKEYISGLTEGALRG